MKQQQKLTDAWNAKYSVGTEVFVRRDNGEEQATRTRSKAWLLGGHTAVVMVDGISGCYLLKRCRAVPHGRSQVP